MQMISAYSVPLRIVRSGPWLQLPKGMTEAREILNYNAFVMGEHEYYQMATGVSVDFRDVGYHVNRTMKRLGDRLKKEPKEHIGGAVVERYGSSNCAHQLCANKRP